jgi:hypothetical protein
MLSAVLRYISKLDAMPDVAALIEDYQAALHLAEALAPPSERQLYEQHGKALAQLCGLLSAEAPSSEIAAAVASERRAFGWSYLPGAHGERVETAFGVLAKALDQLHLVARLGENGV